MVDVLDRHAPGHGFTREDFRPALRDGFPWHRHEQAHLHLCDPDAWWEEISRLIGEAFTTVGLTARDLTACTGAFRQVFLDPAAWVVYDDTERALTALSKQGWRHVIVSNHVPELAGLVADLGLAQHFDNVITSAVVGYEKPHPEIFRLATQGLARADVIMVGDNPVADIAGANAAGIRAYLVRTEHADHAHYPDLHALVTTLAASYGGDAMVTS